MSPREAFNRGHYDATHDRAPIFRSTRAYGIVAETDDPLSDKWTTVNREQYLCGYYSDPDELDPDWEARHDNTCA
jgi:hypothetical protein